MSLLPLQLLNLLLARCFSLLHPHGTVSWFSLEHVALWALHPAAAAQQVMAGCWLPERKEGNQKIPLAASCTDFQGISVNRNWILNTRSSVSVLALTRNTQTWEKLKRFSCLGGILCSTGTASQTCTVRRESLTVHIFVTSWRRKLWHWKPFL